MTRTIEKRRRQAVTIRDAASPMQTESKDRWLWASAGAGCFVVFACAIWLFTHRNESDRRTPEKEPRKSQESTTLQAEKSIKQDVKPVTEPSLKVDDGRRFAESNLNESEKVSPVPAAEKQSGERKNSHPAQDPKKAGTQKPDDGEWVADSQWAGSFKFLPPIEDYSGDVQLEITERIDEKFKARYSTEAGKFEWNVEGTIHNKEVKWEFVKAIKDNEDKSVVGNAYFEGRLDGKTLTGKFLMRNSSNTAEIRITRNP